VARIVDDYRRGATYVGYLEHKGEAPIEFNTHCNSSFELGSTRASRRNQFNGAGQLVASDLEENGKKGHLDFSYSPEGRITRKGTFSFEYDGAGRMSRLIRPTKSRTENWLHQYDGAGRLSMVQLPTGDVRYEYDDAGRLKLARRTENGIENDAAQLEYDAAGRLVRKVRRVDGRVRVVEYGYDAQGRLERVKWSYTSDPGKISGLFHVEYDRHGLPVLERWPDVTGDGKRTYDYGCFAAP
jgi:YD repeat-containing protein